MCIHIENKLILKYYFVTFLAYLHIRHIILILYLLSNCLYTTSNTILFKSIGLPLFLSQIFLHM